MKSDPSETATAFFSVHVTCPTVYRGQIVSMAVCPTWHTYLFQEQEKNRPPLENNSRLPLNARTKTYPCPMLHDLVPGLTHPLSPKVKNRCPNIA